MQVTGTFPMGNDFAGYDFTGTTLHNGTITLPTDWVWLAQHFAEDYTLGSTFPGSTPMRWDIHDDQTNAEGHVLGSGCSDLIGATESVDNCVRAPRLIRTSVRSRRSSVSSGPTTTRTARSIRSGRSRPCFPMERQRRT